MMKKLTLFFLFLSYIGFAQVTTSPSPAIATGPVTIFFNKANTPLANYNGLIYAHMGVTVNGTRWTNVIGEWASPTQPTLTLVSGTTYKLDIAPDLFSYFGVAPGNTITEICIVLRGAGGSPQTADLFIPVGAFQVTLQTPAQDSVTILNSGASLNITASNTGGNANYNLLANGVSINSATATSSYSFLHTNITANQTYTLEVTSGESVITRTFTAIVNPNLAPEAIPLGMRDGINYNPADASKATLVLNAPGKDFVYVSGSFNNWQPSSTYALKKDTASSKFWIELSGLTSAQQYTFQYWVVDQTPLAGSPALVKTSDPFSTMVLSPFDDPYIPATVYPNLPAYPAGQSFEVSVLQTNQPAYDWQVTNFTRPAKEDLIIYELLIRDFDQQKTWEGLSSKIGYLKDLHINAVEIMPVMEFEGNISWGYNTAFHMALDKSYGTREAMKQFVDLCHQNGIAVILDVALNHVYGRSPLARMWMNDPDGDGFGEPTSENPYCNVIATHSYSVGSDLNHQSLLTQTYSQRTIEYWMSEFKIDGYRWDLTKGFTQNCTNNEGCTNNYQADRVAILKQYADYQWNIDPNFYVIFEHLGVGTGPNSSAAEETEWANYKVGEGKGIMFWGKLNEQYNQNSMGYPNNSNFNSIDFESRGFSAPRLVGYAESHDEERLNFKNLLYGASAGTYDVKNLSTALERTKAIGAVFLTVPGPKMIWQFGELGYEFSINRCPDGTISNNCRTDPKPNPFELGYTSDPERMAVYNTWATLNTLRLSNPVFHTTTFTIASGNLNPRIDIWNDNLPGTMLKNVVVLANFNLSPQTVNTFFPTEGTWYNLLDDSTINSTTASIILQPGEFRIFGNQPAVLANNQHEAKTIVSVYPNPSLGYFSVNTTTTKVQVYSITGQLVKSFSGQQESSLFDITNLSKGIYLVKVTDSNNIEKTLKLAKQ